MPPVLAPPPERPAVVAEARRSTLAPARAEEASRPSFFALRLGVGLGLGSHGIAQAALATADLWPLPFLGVGAEAMTGGSGQVSPLAILIGHGLFSPTDSMSALRARLAVRHYLRPRDSVSVTFSYGPATETYDRVKDNAYVPGHARSVPSFGAEIGFQRRWSFFELGGHLRADIAGPVVLVMTAVTMGFTL